LLRRKLPLTVHLALTSRPAVPYLASVPVLFSLVGLAQPGSILVVCHVANLTPGELRSRLSEATGHSSLLSLSIAGLTLKELPPHVSKTNRHLPANSQLHVSLHNGPKNLVITGPPKALFGLVTSLRKIKAQSGLDQSKTPFSN
jgi:hypothetical protein